MRIRKTAILIIFFALVIFSLCSSFDTSTTSGLPSYRLTTKKTETGNTTRVDYIDETGDITFAKDKHYARRIKRVL